MATTDGAAEAAMHNCILVGVWHIMGVWRSSAFLFVMDEWTMTGPCDGWIDRLLLRRQAMADHF